MNNIPEYSAIVIIVSYLIKQIFTYLKTRKDGKSNGGYDQAVLEQIKVLNQNHLTTIDRTLNEGFDRVVDTMNKNDQKIIELLGRIDGRLSK